MQYILTKYGALTIRSLSTNKQEVMAQSSAANGRPCSEKKTLDDQARNTDLDNDNDDTIIERLDLEASDEEKYSTVPTKTSNSNDNAHIESNVNVNLRFHKLSAHEIEEDDEEDDEPPILKYTRLSALPPNFFRKDPISTLYYDENLFIFGTHTGLLLFTKPDFTHIRSFRAHKASVLSLYTDGTYFASGSMDGTVVIGSVDDANDIVMFDYKRPVHAVVLDKNYQKKPIVYIRRNEWESRVFI